MYSGIVRKLLCNFLLYCPKGILNNYVKEAKILLTETSCTQNYGMSFLEVNKAVLLSILDLVCFLTDVFEHFHFSFKLSVLTVYRINLKRANISFSPECELFRGLETYLFIYYNKYITFVWNFNMTIIVTYIATFNFRSLGPYFLCSPPNYNIYILCLPAGPKYEPEYFCLQNHLLISLQRPFVQDTWDEKVLLGLALRNAHKTDHLHSFCLRLWCLKSRHTAGPSQHREN